MTELLIGCGNSRDKRIGLGSSEKFNHLITLDISPECNPDVVHDLNVTPYPFDDNAFDEIHAYEVLEHCGTQGDWRFFFRQFDEFHRILKSGGVMFATVPSPSSKWAFGDPGHTRIFDVRMLTFLCRSEYERQVGITSMTDYRPYFKSNWEVIEAAVNMEESYFVIKAIK